MMRVALIGDVHANLPALEAVVQHARRHRVRGVWGVGDWVGYGAFPEEVVQWLRQRDVQAIVGNYDLSVLKVEGKRAKWINGEPPEKWRVAAWAFEQLSAESREYLRSLPQELRLEVEGKRILLTHASPASVDEYLTADTPLGRLRELAGMAAADVIAVGHAHMPFARKVSDVWFINTGSVGRPKGGDPRACYAILSVGPKRVQVRHYRVEYDVEKARAALHERHAPAELAEVPQASLGTRQVEEVINEPSTVPPSLSEAEDNRLQAVLQLARSCEYEEGHTHQVTRLALQLFDELHLLHGLGPTERHWLHCAALLHDIGLIEGVKGHHKASLRIILDTPLLPFGKSERLLIGSVARYHRAALPAQRHNHFARLKPALRRTVRMLAAILRVADGLDYTHQSLVEDLTCVLSPQQIVIRCTAKRPADAERLRGLEKGDLMEQVFERNLVIECHGS